MLLTGEVCRATNGFAMIRCKATTVPNGVKETFRLASCAQTRRERRVFQAKLVECNREISGVGAQSVLSVIADNFSWIGAPNGAGAF